MGQLALNNLLLVDKFAIGLNGEPPSADGAVIGVDGTRNEGHLVEVATHVEGGNVLVVANQGHTCAHPQAVVVGVTTEFDLALFTLNFVQTPVVAELRVGGEAMVLGAPRHKVPTKHCGLWLGQRVWPHLVGCLVGTPHDGLGNTILHPDRSQGEAKFVYTLHIEAHAGVALVGGDYAVYEFSSIGLHHHNTLAVGGLVAGNTHNEGEGFVLTPEVELPVSKLFRYKG